MGFSSGALSHILTFSLRNQTRCFFNYRFPTVSTTRYQFLSQRSIVVFPFNECMEAHGYIYLFLFKPSVYSYNYNSNKYYFSITSLPENVMSKICLSKISIIKFKVNKCYFMQNDLQCCFMNEKSSIFILFICLAIL